MTEISLEGKIALVTGGGRGMGRAIALAYARAAAVAVTSGQSPDEIAQVTAEIDAIAGSDAGRGLAVSADVTDRAACQAAVAATVERFGRLDILVNNAAKGSRYVSPGRVPFWEADPEGWPLIIDTNVNGPYYVTRAAVPHLMVHNWGRIINLLISGLFMHARHNSPYGPSKAALEAMMLIWAEELAGTGVTVNAINPGGAVDTKLILARTRDTGPALLDPEVVVPAALWLASRDSDGVTGCRYLGLAWDRSLSGREAAEAARESSAFRPPADPGSLDLAWSDPRQP